MNVREEFKKFKTRIPEIQIKLDKIERLAGSCDPRMIDEMTGINIFLDSNRKFNDSRAYQVIATDINIIKADIIDHCICPRRT